MIKVNNKFNDLKIIGHPIDLEAILEAMRKTMGVGYSDAIIKINEIWRHGKPYEKQSEGIYYILASIFCRSLLKEMGFDKSKMKKYFYPNSDNLINYIVF